MRIQKEDMFNEFKRILIEKGLNKESSELSAKIFTQNSIDGVYSHGINRFPRVIDYIEKGYIDLDAEPEKIISYGCIERWDGHLAMGNVNASKGMGRAIELSKEYGVGIVTLKNTNHWMRGGTYGWQAADAGCIGICWTNTMPNMPAWGAKDNRIGNNPFVLAVPQSDGNHVVVDSAMSQFSYGKVYEYSRKDKDLPVAGGYDSDGNLTFNPKEIEKTRRILPTGFWKGSSMSIGLDLIATILSGGLSTNEIGKQSDEEYGISQVLIAIDIDSVTNKVEADKIIENLIYDLKGSEPIDKDIEILYPGERVVRTREDNLNNGIPVDEEIWNSIIKM